MGLIGFIIVIAMIAAVFAAIAAENFRKGWEAKRTVHDDLVKDREAIDAARWETSVKHKGANTLVKVQRYGAGDPMIVARIAEDSDTFEAELHRAQATARQRAALLNAALDEQE